MEQQNPAGCVIEYYYYYTVNTTVNNVYKIVTIRLSCGHRDNAVSFIVVEPQREPLGGLKGRVSYPSRGTCLRGLVLFGIMKYLRNKYDDALPTTRTVRTRTRAHTKWIVCGAAV